MKKRIFIVVSVILLIAAMLFVYFSFLQKPSPMQAHKARITTPLESDKFFDEPDFMIYEIGGERIMCTAEEAAAIYVEFERMIANLYVIDNDAMCFTLEDGIPKLKEKEGVIRFCYEQRRKYTGGAPYTTPVTCDEGHTHNYCPYDWDDFVFDEVLIGHSFLVLGVDGQYKLQRTLTKRKDLECMNLLFRCNLCSEAGEYFGNEFDLAVQEILRIKERFPNLFDKWPKPQYNFE